MKIELTAEDHIDAIEKGLEYAVNGRLDGKPLYLSVQWKKAVSQVENVEKVSRGIYLSADFRTRLYREEKKR